MGESYIVTEYISRNLKNFLETQTKRIQQEDLIHISIGILKGLAYLASRNIVHRDIALRNVMVEMAHGFTDLVR